MPRIELIPTVNADGTIVFRGVAVRPFERLRRLFRRRAGGSRRRLR
jgi:hypothetical protein